MLADNLKTDRFRQDRQIQILVGFILLLGFFSMFFNLGGRTIENQDNIRLAEVGREVLESGDWVMMHLAGGIYVDKPPLHFWNSALAYHVFGTNTFAARLPSALFAFLGLAAILFFCRAVDRENPRTAIYASLFLISSYGYSYYARTARLEMEYSVLFSLSLMAFYLGYDRTGKKGKLTYYLLFWTFMGLAFLEKGPVALIPLLIAAAYLLLRRDWRRLRIGILAAAFPAFILVVLPWVGFLYGHPQFESYRNLLEEARIMTRKEGLLYYFPSLMFNFFPGSAFLLVSTPRVRSWWNELKERPWLVFSATWVIVYFTVLHLTSAKTARYLLPLFLPLSVITAWITDRMVGLTVLAHNLRIYWKAAAAAFAILVCLAPPVWTLFHGGQIHIAVIVSLTCMFSLFFAWRRSGDVVVFVCIVCISGLLSVDVIRATFNDQVSHNMRLYKLLKERDVQADQIFLYRTDREIRKYLGFYYDRLPAPEHQTVTNERGVKAVVFPVDQLGNVQRVYGAGVKTVPLNGAGGGYDYAVLFTEP